MSAPPGTSTNPFEILGLDRSASFEDVKLAYRRLARQYHPDANPDDPSALDRFTTLRRAYDRLKIFYQTLDDAGPVTRPASIATGLQRVAFAARERETPAQQRAVASHAVSPLVSDAGTTSPAPGAESGRDLMPEPTVPGTGSRRAFRRTGPVRHSGDIAPAAPPAAPRTRLAPPQQIGSGPQAARAEIVYGHQTAVPSHDRQMLYALIGLRASDSVVFPRVPLNLCLVLDHSSSMLRGGKVDRLKETVRGIIDQLDEDDYLSIVTFGDRAEVLSPAQPLRNKAMAQGAIDAMRCRGGTEISRGLAVGISELARNASRALSHMILLTDGQTYGDEMACLERAEEAAGMNVGITAYGLGADWNSALLDGIAGPTGGHSDYIESPEEMASAFSQRVLALQSTTLRKVTLSMQLLGDSTVQRATLLSPILRPLEFSGERGAPLAVLGDMSSNTDYRLLLEFVLGPSHAGKAAVADLTFSYDVPGLQRNGETLSVPIAVTVTPDHDPNVPLDPRVTDALRHVTVHRLQQQAWSDINAGDVAKGTGLLKRAAEHLEVAGHGDLASVAVQEAERVESGDAARDENVKRIIYGTRKLG